MLEQGPSRPFPHPRRGDSYCGGGRGDRAAPQRFPHRGTATGPPGEPAWYQLRACPAACALFSAPSAASLCPGMPPNLTGYYRFVSQENMDNYLRALDINVVLRKLVCLLKPDKEIIHTGDHMVIRTITSLRDYVMDFDLGVQFEEDLGPVDGRKCQTTVSWEGDQLVCEQLGEKRNRGWRHWLEGDQLHLRMTAEDEVCVQVFQKVK